MKMKTTLCAVLLSLTSVSMIACSNGESSKGTNTTVSNLEKQTVETLEDRLDKVKADLAITKSEKSELVLESESTILSVKQAEADFNEITEIAINSGNSADLNKITSFKAALDDAKAVDAEVTKKIKTLDLEIGGLELLEKKYTAQIELRDDMALLPSVQEVSSVGADQIKKRIETNKAVIAEVDEALSPNGM